MGDSRPPSTPPSLRRPPVSIYVTKSESPSDWFAVRCGEMIATRWLSSQLLLAVACLLALCQGAHGWPLDDGEGCIVLSDHDFRTPCSNSILASIKPEQPQILILTFSNKNMDTDRDAVTLSNDAATHTKIRNGETLEPIIYPFRRRLPESWVTLMATAEEKNVTLFCVETNETLVNLTTDYTTERLSLNGVFSICSGDSSEWTVSEGEEVTVPLYLQSNDQLLEMTGEGNAKAYLKLNSREIDVPANTTSTANIRRNGSNSTVEVLLRVSDEERYVAELPPMSRPVVVMGGRRGSTRLQLKPSASPSFSPSPSPSPSPPPLPPPSPGSSPHRTSTIVLGVLLAVACIGLLISCFVANVTRKKKLTKNMPTEAQDKGQQVPLQC